MLPAENKFRTKNDVLNTMRKGNGVSSTLFTIRHLPDTNAKLAIVVSKKIDKRAVARNRIRRRIAHIMRALLEADPVNAKIVVIVKNKSINELNYDELQNELKNLLRQLQPPVNQ